MSLTLAALATLVLAQAADYHGFTKVDFKFQGLDAVVVRPHVAQSGRPWIWRTEFFDHRPMVDLALLKAGYTLAYLDLQNQYGSPYAMWMYSQFYRRMLSEYDVKSKVVLEGFSRGGLSAFNWAAGNPDKVQAIYADAPVCDFKSWPKARADAAEDWKRLVAAYGFPTDASAVGYPYNPVDNLEVLAKAKIPLIHVVGEADDVVPVTDNTDKVEARYKKLGGTIQVIRKSGVGHHPHSLDDPKPVVEFILKHADDTAKCPPATVLPTPNLESRYSSAGWGNRSWLDQHTDAVMTSHEVSPDVILLGDSITQGWGGPGRHVGSVAGAAYDQFLGGYRAVNMGMSGDRTQHLLWRIENGAVDQVRPKCVSILIGVNNLPSDEPDAIAQGVEAVVAAVRKRQPSVHIVVTALFPVGKEPGDPRRAQVAAINTRIAKLAKQPKVHVLDLTSDLVLQGGEADLTKMAGDALHLQAKGYAVWGKKLKDLLESLPSSS